MPVRDLRGEEIPVGKVRRTLRYDGLADETSAPWMDLFGAASESKSDVASGRGELHLDVRDGVGGYHLPAFDPEAFREARLRVAIRHDVSAAGSVRLGFADGAATDDPDGRCFYRERGADEEQSRSSVSTGGLWFGRDGETATVDDVATILDGSNGCAIVEVRVRPFECGVTVSLGGAGRGDVAFEDRDCPFAFEAPVRPTIAIDAATSTGTERISLSTVELTLVHN